MEDIDVLPTELRSKSLSHGEIVLEYEDALRAIDFLVRARLAILGWELLVKYPSGRHEHPGPVMGAAMNDREGRTWEGFVQDAAAFCRATISKEYREWVENPANARLTLFFCITAICLEKHG